MDQNFGSFLKQKRMEKMLKLNSFAKQIGISNVYLSYIENGKRPAPSVPVLKNIAKVLDLSEDQASQLFTLAALSHSHSDFPTDILEYISSRPYIIDALRKSMEKNATEQDWAVFQKILDMKNNYQAVK